jgi:hypothetical protein
LNVGTFYLYFIHAANSNQTVGTEFFYTPSDKGSVGCRVGLAQKFNEETSAKVKLDSNANLDGVLKHQLNSSITATLGTGLNLTSVVSAKDTRQLPFSLGFDIKI